MFGMGPGIRLMRFRGVDVTLDFSVLLLIFIFFVPQAAQFSRAYNWDQSQTIMGGALIAVLFIGSILVHELSHAWVGLAVGAKVSAIKLTMFGGATFFSYKPASEGKNFWISIIGPLSNLALWYLFKLGADASLQADLTSLASTVSVWTVVCDNLSMLNLYLAVFNALPGYPMDGGQALRSAVIWITKKELWAAWAVAVLGCLTGGVFAFLAVRLLTGQNTFNALILGLVAFWIISGSIAQLREVLPVSSRGRPAPGPQMPALPLEPLGIQVGQVMERPPRAWDERTPLTAFLQEAEALKLDDKTWLPVLREGYLLGIVTRRLARKGPSGDQSFQAGGQEAVPNLSQVMVPRRNLTVVQAEQDLSQVVETVRASREYPVAVLGPGGYFVGFITRDNLRG
jgi:Zn-dependent protease